MANQIDRLKQESEDRKDISDKEVDDNKSFAGKGPVSGDKTDEN